MFLSFQLNTRNETTRTIKKSIINNTPHEDISYNKSVSQRLKTSAKTNDLNDPKTYSSSIAFILKN